MDNIRVLLSNKKTVEYGDGILTINDKKGNIICEDAIEKFVLIYSRHGKAVKMVGGEMIEILVAHDNMKKPLQIVLNAKTRDNFEELCRLDVLLKEKAVVDLQAGIFKCNYRTAEQEAKIADIDSQSITDKIFWEKPSDWYENAKLLSKATGISRQDANLIMKNRCKDWKRRKKLGEFPNTQYCPYCGSQDIEAYEEPGITVTSKTNAFGGAYITSSAPNSKWMRCHMCRSSWAPKRKRR